MNANAAKPEVILHLDKPRVFRMDWNALCQLEKRLGKSAFAEIDWENPGLNDITNIIWGGLLSSDPTLTFDQVCSFLSPGAIADIKMQVLGGVVAAMPEIDPEHDAKKNS